MHRLRQRPFFVLLAALLLLVVVYPVLHETAGSREVYDVLRTAVLLAALRVIFAERRQFFTGVGLAAALIAAIGIGYLLPGPWALPLVLVLHALATVFFLAAIGAILWTVYQRTEVDADCLAGALCAYLLVGVVFAHAYWFIETVAPGSFRGDGEFASELADPRKSLFALTYYSFVTLASVGANDVTPVRAGARGLTILEAICGQFYIAVLIADLIGKKVSSLPPKAAPHDNGPLPGGGMVEAVSQPVRWREYPTPTSPGDSVMKAFGSALLAMAAVALATPPIRADDPADKEAIARNGEAFIAAFHKGDASALAAFWVADGDYTIQTGRQLKGREAIEKELAAMFAEHKGLKIQVESETLRFVTPDVAVEDGVTTVVPADGSLPTRSRFTNVHVKKDGTWLLSSARDSPYSPPTNFEHLRGLAWAMGEWAAEGEKGESEHLTLSWADNQNFVLGSFASKVKGATVGSATHWIGWDPAGKRVRSWVFEGDGGFGDGAWTRDGDRWTVKLTSVLQDGRKASATVELTRVDDDTLGLSTTNRTVDGKALPGSKVLKLKRVK